MSASGHSNYALERSAKRKRTRDRIHGQVLHPIDTPSLLRDPLSHSASRLRGTFDTIKLVAVAAVVHAMIIAVLYAASDLIGQHTTQSQREIVAVTMIDIPKKTEPEPASVQPATPIVPDFGRDAEEPPKKRTRPKPKKTVKTAPVPEETKRKDTPPPRYRTGISLESTVEGGRGPAMETGSSRMGKTPTTARGRQEGAPSPDGKAGGKGSATAAQEGETRQQRRASNIPTQGSVFVKPKRARPSKAPYPKTLKAQGIEGDVKVRVSVGASGRVESVAVVGSSGHKAFDDAARKAALAEEFRPATRDGKAVPFTLSYSYRFRIEEE